jgi:hypothetical protein
MFSTHVPTNGLGASADDARVITPSAATVVKAITLINVIRFMEIPPSLIVVYRSFWNSSPNFHPDTTGEQFGVRHGIVKGLQRSLPDCFTRIHPSKCRQN